MTTETIPRQVLHDTHTHGDAARFLVPLGRVCLSLIFLRTLVGHFAQATIGYAAQQGVPMPGLLVPLSGVIAFVGGVSVVLGLFARWGAALLIAFLIPVTLTMHAFWNVPDPMLAQMQEVNFLKNVAILGGALFLLYFGAGPVSFDERRYARTRG